MDAALAAVGDDTARVSIAFPLRANLSALDNVALIPLYQRGVGAARAADEARTRLAQLDATGLALLRDPDMNASQRFVVKLARALILQRPRLVIDTPAALLPDVRYPDMLRGLAARVDGAPWDIYDYDWNKGLWLA